MGRFKKRHENHDEVDEPHSLGALEICASAASSQQLIMTPKFTRLHVPCSGGTIQMLPRCRPRNSKMQDGVGWDRVGQGGTDGSRWDGFVPQGDRKLPKSTGLSLAVPRWADIATRCTPSTHSSLVSSGANYSRRDVTFPVLKVSGTDGTIFPPFTQRWIPGGTVTAAPKTSANCPETTSQQPASLCAGTKRQTHRVCHGVLAFVMKFVK